MLALLLLGACNDAGYALVSISPIYGWTDGCGSITLSGHGFGKELAASIGEAGITGLTTPDDADAVGYQVYGVVPAGAKGLADVSLRSDGVESKLTGTSGYYYVECPGPGTVDTVSPTTGLAAGSLVTVSGCGLDAAAITVRLVDAAEVPVAADVPLVSMCGTGAASFEAPALPDGTYYVELVDVATQAVLAGAPCGPVDSADTASSCTDHTLTYGEAE